MAIPVIPRHRITPGSSEEVEWQRFIMPPPEPGSTFDRITPDITYRRELLVGYDMPLPFKLPNGSNKLKMWVIKDPALPAQFPAPLVRVRQGQRFNCITSAKSSGHTIHWHGIEPTPLNDGVGKHSFEIKGNYTYQWIADKPGFYFYHCHKNTALHFENGLYGALIVDPEKGEGWVEGYDPANNNLRKYDSEIIWVTGAHDWRWHDLGTDHAMSGIIDANDPKKFTNNGILNDWKPNVFTITGAPAKDANTIITDPRAAKTVSVGQKVLIRLLNSSYAKAQYTFDGPLEIIGEDARAFGVPPYGTYSRPWTVPAKTPFMLTTAQRYDMWWTPTVKGTYNFRVDYIDWRWGGKTLGTARTTVTVK